MTCANTFVSYFIHIFLSEGYYFGNNAYFQLYHNIYHYCLFLKPDACITLLTRNECPRTA